MGRLFVELSTGGRRRKNPALYLTWPSHYADGFLAAHTLISEFAKVELIGWLGGNNAHTSVSTGGTYTRRANMADRFEFISSRHDIAPRWLDR